MHLGLYEFAHILKNKVPFIWEIAQSGNDVLFVLLHNKTLRLIPKVLRQNSDELLFRYVTINDIDNLESFFLAQPKDSYKFFQPHKFDKKTLLKLYKQKSFLMFVAEKHGNIVGYFFLRCSFNKKAFWGWIVDSKARNQGIGKRMAVCMSTISKVLGFRMFASISPENYASLKSIGSVTNLRIIKTLDNGYLYIENTPR